MSDRAIYEPLTTSLPQLVQLPANEEPSLRIKGGSNRVIQKLHQHIPEVDILLEASVSAIQVEESKVLVQSQKGVFTA